MGELRLKPVTFNWWTRHFSTRPWWLCWYLIQIILFIMLWQKKLLKSFHFRPDKRVKPSIIIIYSFFPFLLNLCAYLSTIGVAHPFSWLDSIFILHRHCTYPYNYSSLQLFFIPNHASILTTWICLVSCLDWPTAFVSQSQAKIMSKTFFLTYFYIFIYILLSSCVILYNKVTAIHFYFYSSISCPIH